MEVCAVRGIAQYHGVALVILFSFCIHYVSVCVELCGVHVTAEFVTDGSAIVESFFVIQRAA